MAVPITNLAAEFKDFADTAAVIENLDLVVSVDTAVLHLAGAMAKPVWALLPFAPDWRWMLGRQDSPWYPTMRLFRQKIPGQAGDVFQRVRPGSENIRGQTTPSGSWIMSKNTAKLAVLPVGVFRSKFWKPTSLPWR